MTKAKAEEAEELKNKMVRCMLESGNSWHNFSINMKRMFKITMSPGECKKRYDLIHKQAMAKVKPVLEVVKAIDLPYNHMHGSEFL